MKADTCEVFTVQNQEMAKSKRPGYYSLDSKCRHKKEQQRTVRNGSSIRNSRGNIAFGRVDCTWRQITDDKGDNLSEEVSLYILMRRFVQN